MQSFYHENYVTYSRQEAERVSAIHMPANKRNGRKQEAHLIRARAVQNIDYPDGEWRNREGRPKGSSEQRKMVIEWRKHNPEGKKVDCVRETGLTKPTVYKWWNECNVNARERTKGAREMTAEEKKEYDRLVKGAEQMELDFEA